MRLTQLLFRRDRLPNGNIFRGKDKMIKRVTPFLLRKVKENFEVEEKNMLYLRNPYLTEEQSIGHAKALGKAQKRAESFKDQTQQYFKEDVTLFERLLHLRVGENWDK